MNIIGNTRVLNDGTEHIPKDVIIRGIAWSKGAILALKNFVVFNRSFCETPKLFARDGDIDEVIW